ncbi:hypothetical protein [Tolypothrix sp. VBCCA 56010]|uniref:hypothetical protein n=1 Tax=Tolypothrix sp. VBCCA 56010 TaxID=3137731 RepID=UPI003D7CC679
MGDKGQGAFLQGAGGVCLSISPSPHLPLSPSPHYPFLSKHSCIYEDSLQSFKFYSDFIDIYTYTDIFIESLKIKKSTDYERFKIFQPLERVFVDGRSSYADQR